MLHKRLYNGIYKEGHHKYTLRQTRRLQAVIELYKRLYDDAYLGAVEKHLERVFGPNEFYTVQIKEPRNGVLQTFYQLKSTREDRMGEEEKLKYFAYRKAEYIKLQKQRQRDLELLGKLIAKYEKTWWD